MANRYWVGGSGTWNTSSTTNWSATSGGSGGASAPTSADYVYIDSNSGLTGTSVISVTANVSVLFLSENAGYSSMGFKISASTYTITSASSMTLTWGTWDRGILRGIALSGIHNIGGGMNSKPDRIEIHAPGATYEVSASVSPSTTTGALTAGTFRVTGSTTLKNFTTSGTSARSLLLVSGSQLYLTGVGVVFDASSNTNFTANVAGDIFISDTSGTSKTFAGGNKSYNALVVNAGCNLTITGGNTFEWLFANFTYGISIKFPHDATTRVRNWSISGSSGNLATISSTSAGTVPAAIEFIGTGVVNADYLSISQSAATPANTWYAGSNSVIGNWVTGWVLGAPPKGNGLFFGSNF